MTGDASIRPSSREDNSSFSGADELFSHKELPGLSRRKGYNSRTSPNL